MAKHSEVEIKLPVADPAAMRRLLRRAGLRLRTRRTLETNVVYDTPGGHLRESGLLLRLRGYGGAAILTFKGPPQPGRHKTREERECAVADPLAMAAILEHLGFRPAFYYEKFRTIFAPGRSPNHAALDETPIGDFLELEGSPSWIDRTAHRLGFAPSDYITASYGRLYLDLCGDAGIQSNRMAFPKQNPRRPKAISVVRSDYKGRKHS